MKPDIELKKVKDDSYVIIIDPARSNTAVYIKDENGDLRLMRPKNRKVDKAKVIALPVSQRGEAASRRAAFVVHDGGLHEEGKRH